MRKYLDACVYVCMYVCMYLYIRPSRHHSHYRHVFRIVSYIFLFVLKKYVIIEVSDLKKHTKITKNIRKTTETLKNIRKHKKTQENIRK